MKYTEDKRGELVHFTVEPVLTSTEYVWAKEVVEKARLEKVTAIVTKISLEANKAISAYHPTVTVYAGVSDIMDFRNMCLGYALTPILSTDGTAKELKDSIDFESQDKIMLCEEIDGKLTYSFA
jgi:hypothetical protein